ncbi:MAG: hypothetical protein KAG53_11890 [Endozoicomonadaceae bacterium]|nr:hypothetical protein [Endozoicomonadaceae bacterium]
MNESTSTALSTQTHGFYEQHDAAAIPAREKNSFDNKTVSEICPESVLPTLFTDSPRILYNDHTFEVSTIDTIKLKKDGLASLRISPDDRHIVTTTNEAKFGIWKRLENKWSEVGTIMDSRQVVITKADFNHDGTHLATVDCDNGITFWRCADESFKMEHRIYQPDLGALESFNFSHNKNRIMLIFCTYVNVYLYENSKWIEESFFVNNEKFARASFNYNNDEYVALLSMKEHISIRKNFVFSGHRQNINPWGNNNKIAQIKDTGVYDMTMNNSGNNIVSTCLLNGDRASFNFWKYDGKEYTKYHSISHIFDITGNNICDARDDAFAYCGLNPNYVLTKTAYQRKGETNNIINVFGSSKEANGEITWKEKLSIKTEGEFTQLYFNHNTTEIIGINDKESTINIWGIKPANLTMTMESYTPKVKKQVVEINTDEKPHDSSE